MVFVEYAYHLNACRESYVLHFSQPEKKQDLHLRCRVQSDLSYEKNRKIAYKQQVLLRTASPQRAGATRSTLCPPDMYVR